MAAAQQAAVGPDRVVVAVARLDQAGVKVADDDGAGDLGANVWDDSRVSGSMVEVNVPDQGVGGQKGPGRGDGGLDLDLPFDARSEAAGDIDLAERQGGEREREEGRDHLGQMT